MTIEESPEWTLSDDHKTLTITFPGGASAKLDAEAADGLMDALGLVRAQMEPPHPERPAPGEITIAADPGWQVDKNRTLHIRDGRFGWLHYRLSPETADRMGRALKKD